MALISRQADLLQRALDGERVTDEQVRTLVESARALSTVSTQAMAPRPEFVQSLRERLMAEAATLPTPSPAAAKASAARRAAARSRPVVLVVGRGVPRLVAGATASALAVGAVLGVASRSSLPGGALYPVKGWLDSIAVLMADSDFDRGVTRLSQAQEHISEARTLSEASRVDADHLVEAITAATDDVRRGQRDLSTAFDRTGNPQALLAIRDFSARALPQVEALRPEVPAAVLPALGELEALLGQTQGSVARRIAACGTPCAGSAAPSGPATSPVSLPQLEAQPTTTSGQATGTRTAGPSIEVVAPTITGRPGGGSTVPAPPEVTAGDGGVTIGNPQGGATVSTGGSGVTLPSVSVSLPGVPSVSATVGLPSATLATSSGGGTVSRQSIGGLTLPGVTADP
jgi:hypothetical protein